MKSGGWLYSLQNQNIRVLSMFFPVLLRKEVEKLITDTHLRSEVLASQWQTIYKVNVRTSN